jgi:hypothetical protein
MPYYPKSQVTTNLYTNGEEFITDLNNPNGSKYIGYYWKTSDGSFFSGQTPQDTPIVRLFRLLTSTDPNSFNTANPTVDINIISSAEVQVSLSDYVRLKRENTAQKVFLPTYSPTLPTQQDYQIGEMRRYFCKKTNEIIYLETSKETYDKLATQDPQILWQLYLPFNLPWRLTGNKEDVYKTNRNITELTSVKLKLPMLSSYLKEDFTKYYRG